MMKKYLGIICILYSSVIIYVITNKTLNYYLAPTMQLYIKLSILPLIIIGLVLLINNNISYKFKISDLILLLPIIMIILSGDGRLSMRLSTNRNNSLSKNNNKEEIIVPTNNNDIEEEKEYDLSNIYFDVKDASYDGLANYITYHPKAIKYKEKTIRVRGFTNIEASYIPTGYFAIGKYSISCCAADATYVGFIAKYNKEEIKNNEWYEIEGVLDSAKDKNGTDIMTIKVINIKKINEEEQYVYQCYAYDDGMCKEITKYNLEY